MLKPDIAELLRRISDLEAEVSQREQDLRTFRSEVERLNGKIEGLIGQVTSEIQIITKIHKFLVPTEIPGIPGFEFSSKFEASGISGGDYFDIFDLEDKLKFGLIFSSSSGHALSALLLAVFFKMNAMIKARTSQAAGEVLAQLIKEINIGINDLPASAKAQKASLFFAFIDRRRFEMNYALLGDVCGVLHQYDPQKLESLVKSGGEVDASTNFIIESHTVMLNPRDRLILASPGFVNAKNPKGEVFGPDRFYRVALQNVQASIHDLRNSLFFEVKKFMSSVEPQRDQTIMVVDVQDRVIKLAKS